MEEIRFYMDEHIARAVTRGLRHRGVDVIVPKEVDLLGASDEKHWEFAQTEGRVIFTQDDDFLRLASHGFPHAGIVYAPQHTAINKIISGLMLIHQVLCREEMQNHIEFIS
jgi:predicted nuclease of predicted toxin-antitoxin system